MVKRRVKKAVEVKEVKRVSLNGTLASVWGFVAWLTGVVVSLAVGFGMISGILLIPYVSNVGDNIIVETAGWIVIILTLFGAVIAILDKIHK